MAYYYAESGSDAQRAIQKAMAGEQLIQSMALGTVAALLGHQQGEQLANNAIDLYPQVTGWQLGGPPSSDGWISRGGAMVPYESGKIKIWPFKPKPKPAQNIAKNLAKKAPSQSVASKVAEKVAASATMLTNNWWKIGGFSVLVLGGAGTYTMLTSEHQLKMQAQETATKNVASWLDQECAKSPERCKAALKEAQDRNLLVTGVPTGLDAIPFGGWVAIIGIIGVAGIFFWRGGGGKKR
jgi:hypothetical protein